MRSPHLVIWQEPSTWFEIVGRFLEARLGVGGASAWKKRDDLGSLCAGDSEWQAMLESSLGHTFDLTCEEFADDLANFNIDGFHACRPLDVAEYLTEGLCTATRAKREEHLFRLTRELEVERGDEDRLLKTFREEMSVPDIDIEALFLHSMSVTRWSSADTTSS